MTQGHRLKHIRTEKLEMEGDDNKLNDKDELGQARILNKWDSFF